MRMRRDRLCPMFPTSNAVCVCFIYKCIKPPMQHSVVSQLRAFLRSCPKCVECNLMLPLITQKSHLHSHQRPRRASPLMRGYDPQFAVALDSACDGIPLPSTLRRRWGHQSEIACRLMSSSVHFEALFLHWLRLRRVQSEPSRVWSILTRTHLQNGPGPSSDLAICGDMATFPSIPLVRRNPSIPRNGYCSFRELGVVCAREHLHE